MSFAVQGWCPGALRPMASGDGLVVRVRLPIGRMTPAQAQGLAQAARTHGNGQMEISNRANLQLRGVRPDSHRALLADLAALGVLDADLALEARRNILLSPFWGEGDGTTDLSAALQSRLMDLPDLPAKFGHVIDIGPTRVLADASGDLRVERGLSGGLILRADGAALGQPVTRETAVAALIALAQWFVDQGGIAQGRGRMRGLALRGILPPGAVEAPVAASVPPLPGATPLGSLAGFEFGAFPAETLAALAVLDRPLRLTPWRMMLIEGQPDTFGLGAVPGLILDPASPMLGVRACPGAPFCPQAQGPTRDLARRLAPRVPPGQTLHVSGCAKGCAHPWPADLTLVAQSGVAQTGVAQTGVAQTGGFALGRACKAEQVGGAAWPLQRLLQDSNLFDAKGPP